jgi:hypothetical protein
VQSIITTHLCRVIDCIRFNNRNGIRTKTITNCYQQTHSLQIQRWTRQCSLLDHKINDPTNKYNCNSSIQWSCCQMSWKNFMHLRDVLVIWLYCYLAKWVWWRTNYASSKFMETIFDRKSLNYSGFVFAPEARKFFSLSKDLSVLDFDSLNELKANNLWWLVGIEKQICNYVYGWTDWLFENVKLSAWSKPLRNFI